MYDTTVFFEHCYNEEEEEEEEECCDKRSNVCAFFSPLGDF